MASGTNKKIRYLKMWQNLTIPTKIAKSKGDMPWLYLSNKNMTPKIV